MTAEIYDLHTGLRMPSKEKPSYIHAEAFIPPAPLTPLQVTEPFCAGFYEPNMSAVELRELEKEIKAIEREVNSPHWTIYLEEWLCNPFTVIYPVATVIAVYFFGG